MNDINNIITVHILDRAYKIKCPVEDAHELQEAARYIDSEMRKMRHATSVSSTDRIAIITALNTCHELMQLKKQKNQYFEVMQQKIDGLTAKISEALAEEPVLA